MRSLLATLLTLSSAALIGAAPHKPDAERLMRGLVEAIGSGDQAVLNRFVTDRFAPAALAEYPAHLWASELAKNYVDTGGLTIQRIAGRGPDWLQAEGRDRMSATRQCLTLRFKSGKTGAEATDFSVRGLYDAGPRLSSPSQGEVVRTLGGLAERFDRRGLMSGVLLIARGDQVLFERAYGFADVSRSRRNATDTRLNLASIGKSITGVAIAQLVEQGKLGYDDKVGRFLPDYPDAKVRDQVTIRQLLSHTGGLGPLDYYQMPQWAGRGDLRSVGAYLKLIEDEKIGVGAPQGQFLYSNAGYVLLGAIIERVTGESFYDHVDRSVFRPAGMTSAFYPEAGRSYPHTGDALTNLFPHGKDGFIFRIGRPRDARSELAARGGPQGGPSMTARDLLRFDQALRGGRLIGPARLKEMLTAHSPSGAGAKGLVGDVREGLGIEVIRQNGHLYYGHTGGDLGVAAMDYWFPDSGYTVILLSNLDPRAGRVFANVSRALLTRRTIGGATPPPQHCEPPTD